MTVDAPVAPDAKAIKGPSKEAAARTRKGFFAALDAKDFDKAVSYLHIPEEFKDQIDKVKSGLAEVRGTKEISKAGIDILARKGKWGKLKDIQGEPEARRMAREGVDLDSCFGLFVGTRAGAAFYWNGKRFLITYFNNIGHLQD
ncbi:MAG: hypothetical protein FJ271_31735 [Planctomycetes bacterium]|nr:hypothetical protein [Planctomycetota bacterium]